MNPVFKWPTYLVHIWTNDESHYIGYSSVTQGYYVTKNKENAEKFMNIQDGVEAFIEFCETHRKDKDPLEYEIIGFNINLERP